MSLHRMHILEIKQMDRTIDFFMWYLVSLFAKLARLARNFCPLCQVINRDHFLFKIASQAREEVTVSKTVGEK